MMRRLLLSVLLAPVVVLPAACGGDAPSDEDTAASGAQAAQTEGQLSAVELEQGVGPIRDLELGPVDPALASQGETFFATKCSACHKLEERFVAPALGEVLSRRRPEFVMNMILNADEMVQRHPVIRELLAEFYTPMPVQVRDPDEARAILEYLRSEQTGSTTTPSGSGASR
ncbi:MAG: cytochrome c [Gemmatimonadales bacterium]|nr:MAG: cytochrome c [Gemmatimonadales bacterium]